MSDAPLARSPLDALGERWQAAWTGRHGGSFTDCCTRDVQYEDPLAIEPLAGVEALAEHSERLWRAFPDVRVERTAPRIGVGTHACLPWRLLGTHKNDLGAFPATDRFLVVHGIHYVELVDGMIRRARGFFDLYDAGVQLGVLPARGGLGETALLLLRGFGLRPKS